jgi:DNA-binding XRE family transcriptional regulator
MEKSSRRTYRKTGLYFSNLGFSTKAERAYVKRNVEEVAARIRTKRKEMNLSQEKLAELASVSVGTIKYIELNQRSPSLPLLFKLLYILERNAKIWT